MATSARWFFVMFAAEVGAISIAHAQPASPAYGPCPASWACPAPVVGPAWPFAIPVVIYPYRAAPPICYMQRLRRLSRTFGATQDLEDPGNSLAPPVFLVSPRHLTREI